MKYCTGGNIYSSNQCKRLLQLPVNKCVFFIQNIKLSKIKCGISSLLINVPQFIVNLFMLSKSDIVSFVNTFKADFEFSIYVLQVCSQYISNMFGANICVESKDNNLLETTVHEQIMIGIKTLEVIDLEEKISVKNTSAGYLHVDQIPVHVASFNSIDCALEVQLNNLKFPKPKVMNEPEYSPTGRNLAHVLKQMTNTMDKKPDSFRDKLYDDSIILAKSKQKVKYQDRAAKTSVNKRNFQEGKQLPLNHYATSKGDNTDNFGYMTVHIKNNSFEFLIDTGALVSFVHTDLVLGDILPSNVRVCTAGSDSSDENVAGEAQIEFAVQGSDNSMYFLEHNFIVLHDVNNFAGILGCDILFNPLYSVSMNFESHVWEVKIKNEKILLPYSMKPSSCVCVSADNFTLEPKQSKLIKVNCVNVASNFSSHHFSNSIMKHDSFEVLPSLQNVGYDTTNTLTSQLMIINKTSEIISITSNTVIDEIMVDLPKNQKEIEIDEKVFLETLESRQLNGLIESYCNTEFGLMPDLDYSTEFGLMPDLNELEEFKKDVKYLSCMNFTTTNIDTSVKKGMKLDNSEDIIKPQIDPDIKSFNEFNEILDDCAKNLGRNVRFEVPSDNEVPCQGYKTNLDQIAETHPELVLPDEYIGAINEEVTTALGESDISIETFSYKDVDLTHIPTYIRSDYERLMEKYEHIFSTHSWDIGRTDLMTVQLDTTKKPVSQKQRQIPRTKLAFVDQAINELSEAGVIRKANSWTNCSNLILVPKYHNVRYNTKAETLRADMSQIRAYRICVDLRNLNEVLSIKCSSLSKPPEKIILPLANKLVTNLDVSQAYFSIPLHPNSQSLTSFFVENNVYCFRRLSQGLLISPRAYECLNDLVYDNDILPQAVSTAINKENFDSPMQWDDIVKCFQDDSWLYSPLDFSHHLFYLSLQFYAIARSGLKLSPKKCKIATTNVKVLGLEVDTLNACLSLDILKSQSILHWPDPSSTYEVHSRLHSVNYYGKFLPKLKEITLPLQELLRDKTFKWTEIHKQAWENLKTLIILDLRLSIPDPTEQLYLFTDASKISCSAVLFVEKQGSLKIVASDSTLFNYSDSLKSPFIKESISLLRGLKKFSNYIGASVPRLKVFTDCKSLLYVSRKREYDIASFNVSNALLYYQSQFSFDIYHITGNTNIYTDLCSRAFSNSRLIKNNTYNLSKEQADILPPLTDPFIINGDVLYEFLMSQPQAERWDTFSKDKRHISTPRPLTNLTKLFKDATPEEKHVSAIRLLHQWNDSTLTRLDYTNQVNKKLGMSVNLMTIHLQSLRTNVKTESQITHLALICSHEDFNITGHLLSTHDIVLQPRSSYTNPNICYLKTNAHVDFRSCINDVELELIPLFKHGYQLRLINLTNHSITINTMDSYAYFFSNVMVQVYRTMDYNFIDYQLKHYLLPVSGLRIANLDSFRDNLDFSSHEMCSLSQIHRLNMINTVKGKQKTLLKKAHLANKLIESNNICPDTLAELQNEDPFCSAQIKLPNNQIFVLVKKVLYKKGGNSNHPHYTTVLPQCIIDEVLQMIHIENGHPSLNLFLNIFSASYYYPGVKNLIITKIHQCVVCAKTHIRPNFNIHKGTQRSYVPTCPRTSISVDIIPRLNDTTEGNNHILLIVDNFSRYGSACLMKDKTQNSILNALKNYFLIQGVPQHIYSDSEASIISACQKLMDYFNFILQTSPAQSQHKNRAENCFKDLKNIIKKVLYEPKNQLVSSDWDLALIYALGIFNNMPLHSSRVLTREFIHFHGTIKSLPYVYGINSEISPVEISKLLDLQHIKKLESYAMENKKISQATFNPGDIIFTKGTPHPNTKNTFAVFSRGPYQILTVDNLTKTVSAKQANSKLVFSIAFEKINKVSLTDINLQLFQGFLDPKKDRDFNMRPRTKPPQAPLHELTKTPPVSTRVTRSMTNVV